MPEKDDIRLQKIDLYEREERLAKVCSALTVPTRRQIVRLINDQPLSINDIAWRLNIPVSTASFHVKVLVEAGILRYSANTKKRGNEKLVSLGNYLYTLYLGHKAEPSPDFVYTMEVPIGSYTAFSASPTCGMCVPNSPVMLPTDTQTTFFSPQRFNAGLIWLHSGYLEYTVPFTDYVGVWNDLRYCDKNDISSLCFRFEMCSETASYNHDFKSDVTFSVNGVETTTFVSTGDFGERRGRLNPPDYPNETTQYGLLYTVDVRFDGTYVNEKRVSDVCVDDLQLASSNTLTFRFEVKEDAVHVGGFNLFGKSFGDYPQDVVVSVTYQSRRSDKRRN